MKNKIKYFLRKLEWVRVFFSPFRRPKFRFYFGKIKYGVPYFYPRKWVNITWEDQIKEAERFIELRKKFGRPHKTVEQEALRYKNTKKAVSKKVGFDFVPLGWKTKWSNDDYRFEHSPAISFVFFGWQFYITVEVPETCHYWEAWLYYHFSTNKKWGKKERINKCEKNFPCTFTSYRGDKKEVVDAYLKILKKKYI